MAAAWSYGPIHTAYVPPSPLLSLLVSAFYLLLPSAGVASLGGGLRGEPGCHSRMCQLVNASMLMWGVGVLVMR